LRPIGTVVAGLPGVLDAVGRLADQQRFEILLDCGRHQVGALGEGRAAVAVKAVLIGDDLDHDQAHAGRLRRDHLDVFDHRRGQSSHRARGLLVRGQTPRRQDRAERPRRRELYAIASGHDRLPTGRAGTSQVDSQQ